ncbi:MAG TPA: hypothetical protein VHX15_08740 [Frankiaceae bacterium]|jgi:DNA-binding NarL/FixJ family response regulator|nr:hypothetical protein [Frankiaceae bacterium]
MAESVTVFLVDDHEVVRQGLRTLLEDAGLAIVGEASTAGEAVPGIVATRLSAQPDPRPATRRLGAPRRPGRVAARPEGHRARAGALRSGPSRTRGSRLTDRERPILDLIAEGLTNRQTDTRLGLA